jgi:hypothetical protein
MQLNKDLPPFSNGTQQGPPTPFQMHTHPSSVAYMAISRRLQMGLSPGSPQPAKKKTRKKKLLRNIFVLPPFQIISRSDFSAYMAFTIYLDNNVYLVA